MVIYFLRCANCYEIKEELTTVAKELHDDNIATFTLHVGTANPECKEQLQVMW